MARLFLDSNVILSGLVSAWTSSHLTLMLCAKGFHRMVTTPYVIEEVENALLRIALQKHVVQAELLLDDYSLFVEIARPEIVSLDENAPEINAARIIRHLHDVPVLAAAIKAKPDWVLSLNRKHFSDDVAQRTSLRIATPEEFLRQTIR